MSMFSKLKEIKDLRSQAKTIQGMLAQETVEATGAWGKVKVKMNGNQEILSLDIDPELLQPTKKSDVEKGVTEAVGDAMKKAQKIMAEKVRSSGALKIPGIN